MPSPQLQEAFSRGALKPGLNVVLDERPKRRNDVVSEARGTERRVPGEGWEPRARAASLSSGDGAEDPAGAGAGAAGVVTGQASGLLHCSDDSG